MSMEELRQRLATARQRLAELHAIRAELIADRIAAPGPTPSEYRRRLEAVTWAIDQASAEVECLKSSVSIGDRHGRRA